MNIILSFIIILVLSLAIAKILKDKKNGSKCSGCPYAGVCTISNNNNLVAECDIEESNKATLRTCN